MKPNAKRPQKGPKAQENGKATQVHWPNEYVQFASHPTETAVSKALTLGASKTKLNRAVLLSMDVVQPTDIDKEFTDGAQNAYKIVKSLTSGARFYSETTGYCYRTNYRFLVVLLARAFGLLQSLKTRLNVANAPNFAAYQILRENIAENYVAALSRIPEYEKLILEMVSELNSMPTPTIGGMDKFFEYFSHIYKEDAGMASDYYGFVPSNVGEATYDDETHVMLAVTRTSIQSMSIPELVTEFNRLVTVIRSSSDMNNLMADMLNTLPSSRYDWMSKLKEHEDFVREVDGAFLTKIGSATLALNTPTAFGSLNADGTEIVFDKASLGPLPDNFHFGGDDEIGQFVSTYRGAGEEHCYELMLHNNNARPGFVPVDSDEVSTTGLFIRSGAIFTDLGTATSAPVRKTIGSAYNDSNSMTQSVAEEGGKVLMMLYCNFSALPKIDMYHYGQGGDDNLLWRREDVKQVALTDIKNNIKAINMIAFSTVHLSTERARDRKSVV